MFTWIFTLLDRLLSVFTALIFLQIPQFIQLYTQRLGGHLNELLYQLRLIEGNAKTLGLTLQAYLHKFQASSDQAFVLQGELMQQLYERSLMLQKLLTSLDQASAFSRPFIFATHFDRGIAQETLSQFQFGLPLSFEGLIYALTGILVSISVTSCLRKIFLKRVHAV